MCVYLLVLQHQTDIIPNSCMVKATGNRLVGYDSSTSHVRTTQQSHQSNVDHGVAACRPQGSVRSGFTNSMISKEICCFISCFTDAATCFRVNHHHHHCCCCHHFDQYVSVAVFHMLVSAASNIQYCKYVPFYLLQ